MEININLDSIIKCFLITVSIIISGATVLWFNINWDNFYMFVICGLISFVISSLMFIIKDSRWD
jgi:uncharacterized membrane protein YgaE (UPF0421/DUF939 family)